MSQTLGNGDSTDFFGHVVGIGASAGGVKALEVFFDHCPDDMGVSYVVIQHLSSTHKSYMPEVLASHTQMPIVTVEEPIALKENHIYLIPPNNKLILLGGKLASNDSESFESGGLTIDRFFYSMAQSIGDQAIAVVLSGTGVDGAKGCEAIKDMGGLVIAQAPETCKFPGMPNALIKVNAADQILAPDLIPEAISKHVKGFANQREKMNLNDDREQLERLLSLLKSVANLDFTDYRLSTIERRLYRRMRKYRLSKVSSYLDLLEASTDELREFHGELLIGVTRFFRDQKAFAFFRDRVVASVVALAQNDDAIRIWIPGCSTGQEVYSIVICFLEYLEQHRIRKDIKVFATDVDKESLDFASQGVYPKSIEQQMSQDLLERYFVYHDGSYEIKTSLRRAVVFSRHNIFEDPPFINLHLISCRNLLIYFQSKLQKKVLSLFHFGLVKHGYLFLGKSEALGELAGEFSVVSGSHKMFSKLRAVRLAGLSELTLSRGKNAGMMHNLEAIVPPKFKSEYAKEGRTFKLYESLLKEFVPPSLIIDEYFNVLHVFGDAGSYLKFPIGESTYNATKLLDRSLSLALNSAISLVAKSGREVRIDEVVLEGSRQTLSLLVRPLLPRLDDQVDTFIVVFEGAEANEASEQKAQNLTFNKFSFEYIESLEEQLIDNRADLKLAVERLEATNEELQSTNEELTSSNEELQSSNEELQSVNEELHSVNSEYQMKNRELIQANTCIDFLLSSSSIATIFLDQDLNIQRFNQEMQKILNVMPQDLGRPISDISFVVGHKKIMEEITIAVETMETRKFKVKGEEGVMQVTVAPHTIDQEYGSNTHSLENSGIVLSVFDLSKTDEGTVDMSRRKPIRFSDWPNNIN